MVQREWKAEYKQEAEEGGSRISRARSGPRRIGARRGWGQEVIEVGAQERLGILGKAGQQDRKAAKNHFRFRARLGKQVHCKIYIATTRGKLSCLRLNG